MVENEQRGRMVEPKMDIPPQKMFTMGCGYTSAVMALQHFGYTDITPHKFFEFVHDKPYHKDTEESGSRTPRANAIILMDAVKKYTESAGNGQTPLEPSFINQHKIDLLKEKGIVVNPSAILLKNIEEGNPCMVRFPAHFVLVKGFRAVQYPDGKKLVSEYIFNNPQSGREQRKKPNSPIVGDSFNESWSSPDPDDDDTRYINTGVDARYLMVIFKPKKIKPTILQN